MPIRTLGDVLDGYDRRVEHKSLAPDGGPVTSTTRGLLLRRPVRSTPALTHLAGKEGNRIEERALGMVTDPTEYQTELGRRADPWIEVVLPIMRRMGAAEVARRTNPRWLWSIQGYIAGSHRPHPRREAAIGGACLDWAEGQSAG